MPARDARPSFNTGEISEETDARFDLAKYSAGCEILENFMPMPTGGVRKRPGTIYVNETKNSGSGAGRVVPFRFSTGTNFVLLFEAGTIRFYSNQAVVTSGGSAYEVTNPYTEAQLFDLHFAQINDVVYVTHPDVAPYKLSRFADTNWTFEEVEWDYPPLLAQNLETSVKIYPSATTGTGITLTAIGTDWLTATTYAVGDYRENPATGLIYKCLVAHTSGTFATDLASEYWELYEVFTDDNEGGYFELTQPRVSTTSILSDLTNTGSYASTAVSAIGEVNVYTTGIWGGELVLQKSRDGGTTWDDILSWVSIGDFNGETTVTFNDEVDLRWYYTYSVTPTPAGDYAPRAVIELEGTTKSGVAKIDTVTSSVIATADVKIDFEASGSANATDRWSEGAWSSRRGFPQGVTLHEQRLCFGGTSHKAQTVWLSGTDDYEDFRFGTAADSPFTVTVGSRNYNGIQWLESKDALMVGTTGGEFAVFPASDSSPLGPTNVSIKNSTNFGSNSVQPALINEAVLYSARANYAVMELTIDSLSEKLVSPELTLLASHIVKPGIAQMDVQRGRWTTLWAVIDDGYVAGMTYERAQDVVAWWKCKTLAGDEIESVASIYGDTDDEVWFVVKRAKGDGSGYVRTVEYMDTGAWSKQDDGDAAGAAFNDCAVLHDGSATTTVTVPSFLVGSTLSVLADGSVLPNVTPTSTTVTISESASKISVGLPYQAKIQPTRPEIGLPNGSSSGSKKRICNVYAKLKNSGYVNVYAHDDTALSRPSLITAHTTGETAGVAPSLLTGVYRTSIASKHQREPGYLLISDSPTPCTVLGLTHEFSVGQRT